MKLQTTDEQLNALQHTVNEARDGTETVRVSKAALDALLKDHYAMNGALARRNQAPEIPESGPEEAAELSP